MYKNYKIRSKGISNPDDAFTMSSVTLLPTLLILYNTLNWYGMETRLQMVKERLEKLETISLDDCTIVCMDIEANLLL